MTKQEEAFLRIGLEYKKEYEETVWWRFKKRIELKRLWKSSLDCMIRYGKD